MAEHATVTAADAACAATAHGKPDHPYHLVDPSPWPLVGAPAALLLTGGGVIWMHGVAIGPWVVLLGFLGVLSTMFRWWRDVLKESRQGRPHAGRVSSACASAWPCSSPPR